MSQAPADILTSLRDLDPELYLACLYLPEDTRSDVASLWAFDAEIRRIPGLVSEPMPGEIRLQWWRDLIRSGDNVDSGPLAQALMATVQKHDLPRETLDTYIEARIFDLYQDPMPDTGTYEGYLGETVSAIFQMAALCSGAERDSLLADVCGHAGMAFGMARQLASASQARAREQVYFPADLLARHGLDREAWLFGDLSSSHDAAMAELLSLARYHLTFAGELTGKLPQTVRPVFLPLAFSRALLDKIAGNPGASLVAPVVLSPLRRQWVAFRAGLRGRAG